MTNLLIRLFIKDNENTKNSRVRTAYGNLASFICIICNALLFIGKFLVGTLSGSVSIAADAVNNLSDASSNIISLIGFKLGSRPADDEHPYGHARYEYLSGLTVSVMILVIGIELLKTSILKIANPSDVEFSRWTIFVLLTSILVKLWMMLFNTAIGKKINSKTLEATARDSLNDVITTSVVLISSVISYYTHLELDGYMGILVALFILYSGIQLVKDTIDPLLGKAPDPEFVSMIQEKILSYPGVLGTHDLIVHDYGPGRLFASVHVEMAAEDDVLKSHDIIDNIERDFLQNEYLHLIIHFDPIETDNKTTNSLRTWINDIVKNIDDSLSIHDLRIVSGPTHTNIIFDCVVPVSFHMSDKDIIKQIISIVQTEHPNYNCIITIDTSYAAIPK